MKRFHVHVGVRDLAQSVRFYSTLFGVEPTVQKHDYAKWMLEDPRVNFAISPRGVAGVDHLGLQVDTGDELAALESQLRSADATLLTETATTCCYAKSDKHWVTDPQGIAWETFHTLGTARVYGEREHATAEADADTRVAAGGDASAAPSPDASAAPDACCTPATSASPCCGPTETAVAPPRVTRKPAAACC